MLHYPRAINFCSTHTSSPLLLNFLRRILNADNNLSGHEVNKLHVIDSGTHRNYCKRAKTKGKKQQRKNFFLIPCFSRPDLSTHQRIAKGELRNPRPNPVYMRRGLQFRLLWLQVGEDQRFSQRTKSGEKPTALFRTPAWSRSSMSDLFISG
jgi:hypothetical protein